LVLTPLIHAKIFLETLETSFFDPMISTPNGRLLIVHLKGAFLLDLFGQKIALNGARLAGFTTKNQPSRDEV
jgi:hypothetical protein